MSNWTHICGALYVETFKEEKNIKKYVKRKLKNAPRITGSERDVDIFINKLSGYNLCSYAYGRTKKYQTCVCISIIGDLRDRCMQQTENEYKKFIDYIEGSFDIRDGSITMHEAMTGETKQFEEGWYTNIDN